MHRLATRLLFMIAPIHKAIIVNTMSHSEHMSYFMSHHTKWLVFYSLVVSLVIFVLKKFRIITSKREYSSSLSDTSYSKYIIPLRLRVEICHTDSNHTESISWKFVGQHFENVSCIELRFLCILVDSGLNVFHCRYFIEDLYFERVEETLTISLELS